VNDRPDTSRVAYFEATSKPPTLPFRQRKDYRSWVTKLLEQALEAVRCLPPDAQDDIARVVLQLTGGYEAVVALSPDECEAIAASKAAARRGEFATDEEVRAVWAKHGL
jgi:hypothetical protein